MLTISTINRIVRQGCKWLLISPCAAITYTCIIPPPSLSLSPTPMPHPNPPPPLSLSLSLSLSLCSWFSLYREMTMRGNNPDGRGKWQSISDLWIGWNNDEAFFSSSIAATTTAARCCYYYHYNYCLHSSISSSFICFPLSPSLHHLLLLCSPARSLRVAVTAGCVCLCDCLGTAETFTFQLRVMVTAEEDYGKMLLNWAVWQKDRKYAKTEEEKLKRKWLGERNLQLSTWDCKAGGEPISYHPVPPGPNGPCRRQSRQLLSLSLCRHLNNNNNKSNLYSAIRH